MLGPPRPCFCGKSTTRSRCGETERFSCGALCGRVLLCGVHTCRRVCHAGQCGPCGHFEADVPCFCGANRKEVSCELAQKGLSVPSFRRSSILLSRPLPPLPVLSTPLCPFLRFIPSRSSHRLSCPSFSLLTPARLFMRPTVQSPAVMLCPSVRRDLPPATGRFPLPDLDPLPDFIASLTSHHSLTRTPSWPRAL